MIVSDTCDKKKREWRVKREKKVGFNSNEEGHAREKSRVKKTMLLVVIEKVSPRRNK